MAAVGVLMAAVCLPLVANANPAPPATKLLDASLVSPGAAMIYFGSATTHTNALHLSDDNDAGHENIDPYPEITTLSASLLAGRNVAVTADKDAFVSDVFQYVQNNINTEFRYGLSKGGRGALIDQSGTPFDQTELMVMLLRKAGVTASYQTGTISVSAQQFGLWTGLVNNLTESTQTFSVDAKAACDLLSDGGMPAIINGASDCEALTGNLPASGTPVTLSHIWVMVGTTSYDPSFKLYRLRTGIDIPAALGCGTEANSTCGTTVKNVAMTGATSTTVSGIPALDGFSPTAGLAQVKTYATAMANYLKTNNPDATVIDIVGGKKLEPQNGAIATTYTPSGNIWSGDIPDQYRTLISAHGYTFYADEIAGRRITLYPLAKIDDSLIDSNVIYTAAGLRYAPPVGETCTNSASQPACISVFVDHPYAGGATTGTYGDDAEVFKMVEDPTFEVSVYRHFDTMQGALDHESGATYSNYHYPETSVTGSVPIVLIHGFGQAAMTAQKNMSDISDVAEFFFDYLTACKPSTTSPVAYAICSNENQGVVADTVNPYRTLTDRLIDGLADTVSTRHHDVGIVYASRTPGVSRLTLQESVSVVAKAGADSVRDAGYNMQAVTLSEVEGAVSPLERGKQFSAASMFFSQDPLGATGGGGACMTTGGMCLPIASYGSVRVFDVAPSQMPAYLALQADATPSRDSSGNFTLFSEYPNGLTCPNPTAICWRKTQLQAVANWGYSTLIIQGGQSELFYKGAGERAYTIWEYMKGGTAITDPFDRVMKTTEIVDAASKARKELAVSAGDGTVIYQAEPDIVSGSGDFPYSLPFIRTYAGSTHKERVKLSDVRTAPENCQGGGCTSPMPHQVHELRSSGPDPMSHDRFGDGWGYNYEVFLTQTSNPSQSLGAGSAISASAAIAQLQVMRDVSGNTDIGSRLTTIVSAINLGYALDYSVKIGNTSDSLHMLPDYTFYSDKNPSAKLSGRRYTGPGGDYLDFSWYSNSNQQYDGAGNFVGSPIGAEGTTYKADSWTFPNGVKITFDYVKALMFTPDVNSPIRVGGVINNNNYAPVGFYLRKVSNNLGRSLTLFSGAHTVTDENGRYADFSTSGCEALNGYASKSCDVFTATNANGLTTRYEYTPDSNSPNPLRATRNNYALRRIYTPGNTATPFQTLVYDDLFRVKQVKDRNGHVTSYYPGGINGSELWKPAYVVSPGGERSFSIYDDKNGEIYSRTAMGRVTTRRFDNSGRLVKTIMPEGNGSQNYYDVRGNITQVRTFSKTCAPMSLTCADDINTYTSYMEGPMVLDCVNEIICNKASTDTDALGNVSNYEWSATTGDLTQVKLPGDRTGTRPQTDLGYTAYAGISFLTSKTEKISSLQSAVTAYAYNSGNHYVLQSVTQDSGGLNLTTGLTFDAVGNLTAADGPRTDVTDITTYQWDTGRRLRAIISPDPDAGGAMLRKATRYTYNGDDLVTKTEIGTASATDVIATPGNLALVTYTELTYDLMGNVTKSVVRNASNVVLNLNQTSYNLNDRPDCTALRMNLASTATDACAQDAALQDRITRTIYNPDGAAIETKRGLGSVDKQIYATYTYTLNGQKASEADANGNVTRLAYDGFDRLQYLYYPGTSVTRTVQPCAATPETYTGPSGCSFYTLRVANDMTKPLLGMVSATDYEQFDYDANGNKTFWRRRNGYTHGYSYDALNRQWLDDLSSGATADVYTAYDLLGRVCDKIFSVDSTTSDDDCSARLSSIATAGIHNAYDKAGRLQTSKDVNGRTVGYGYDQASSRLSLTFPDNVVQAYQYNAANMLTWTGVNGTTLGTTPGYDPKGRLTSVTRSNAVTTSLGYDDLNRITSFGHNIVTGSDVTWTFAYNPASQITSMSPGTSAYDYQEKNHGTDSRAYDGLNRDAAIAAVSGGYDANGNLASEGSASGARTFTYDMDNRLMTVAGGIANVALGYDPLGRLSSYKVGAGTATQFLYDGVNLIAEYQGGILKKRYMHLLGADQPFVEFTNSGVAVTDAMFLLSNYQGSIIALADNAGMVSAGNIFTYGPYGEPMGGNWSGERFRYTGQTALPDAQLYYYKARAYDPKYGRFLQTDPIGSKDDLDLYAYVADDPINHSDPTGLKCSGEGKTLECHMDDTGGLEKTKAGRQQIKDFNKAYTSAVAKLQSHPNKQVTVTVDGKSMKVTAGQVGGQLYNATVNGTTRTSKDADMDTLGGPATGRQPGGEKTVTVYRNAFTDGTNLSNAVTHEGLHMVPQESNLVGYGGAAGKFQDDHQTPYNNAATDLLNGGSQ
jgi:RHS repeat-associated protein